MHGSNLGCTLVAYHDIVRVIGIECVLNPLGFFFPEELSSASEISVHLAIWMHFCPCRVLV